LSHPWLSLAWGLPVLALVIVVVRAAICGAGVAPADAWSPGRLPAQAGVMDASPRAVLAAMPLQVLLAKWQATQLTQRLELRPHEAEATRWVRELIIDELQNRDPAGSARWLADGAVHPPDHYIGHPAREG
jgi:hypothetical protein